MKIRHYVSHLQEYGRKEIYQEIHRYNLVRLDGMADKIDIGLTLTGQDAIDFIEYMKNPTYTEEAKACMREALKLRKTID